MHTFRLSPDDGDVGVVLDDLVEGRQVDAGEAADLVGAVPAGEQPSDADGVDPVVEAVGSGRVTDVHRVSGIWLLSELKWIFWSNELTEYFVRTILGHVFSTRFAFENVQFLYSLMEPAFGDSLVQTKTV